MCNALQHDLQMSCRHCLSQSMLQCCPGCSKTTISVDMYPYTIEVCTRKESQGRIDRVAAVRLHRQALHSKLATGCLTLLAW